MSVDDHGLEVLRKSALEVTPGSKAEYKLRTVGTSQFTGLANQGKITEVSINAVSWTALPATALASRNTIAIQNRSGQDIRLNFDITDPISKGWLLPDQYERSYPITENILIYAVSTVSAVSIMVEELS